MRLSFANGEHADFVMEDGVATLGSADGNIVVLPRADVAARHARLSVDARGVVLEVLDPAARTHVNARPVREKALLRCGDVLCLGKVVIVVKAARDDEIETRVPAPAGGIEDATHPARVVLRGVSGSHFGRAIAVNPRIVVGRDPACGLVIDEAQVAPRHATVEQAGEAIYLRDVDSPNGVRVNGVRVRNAVIHPGDQIAFERSHFVVEAPGLPLRGEDRREAGRAVGDAAGVVADASPSSGAEPAHGAIWWLIGAAALIALGLVALLQRGI
jgi:pSer/pThr/pTyr-binding forkhead associated (FHA) protein